MEKDVLDAIYGRLTISNEAVAKLRFFRKKYAGKVLYTVTNKLSARPDVLKFCDVLFNSMELLQFIKTFERMTEFIGDTQRAFGVEYGPVYNFLKAVDLLRDFYEINRASSIKDKRIDTIMNMKRRANFITQFLERRTIQRPNKVVTSLLEEKLEKEQDG